MTNHLHLLLRISKKLNIASSTASESAMKGRQIVEDHGWKLLEDVITSYSIHYTKLYEPGDTAPVQFRLESPVCCIKDDRYVIRSYSPVRTIGGGAILNPVSQKYKLKDTAIIKGLCDLAVQDDEKTIAYFLSIKGL